MAANFDSGIGFEYGGVNLDAVWGPPTVGDREIKHVGGTAANSEMIPAGIAESPEFQDNEVCKVINLMTGLTVIPKRRK